MANKVINLDDIHDIKVKINFKKIIKKYGTKTAQELQKVSPKSNRPNRKTPYSKGWIDEAFDISHGNRVIVWNKTNWQLTHLLENGHFITNKEGKTPWVSPQPHIRPTYRKIKPKFVKAMEKAEIKVEIK